MGKFDERLFSEQPPPCVLNDSDNDPLLQKLRTVHGNAGRPDVARELTKLAAGAEQRHKRHEVV
jgi:hypothetical protein